VRRTPPPPSSQVAWDFQLLTLVATMQRGEEEEATTRVLCRPSHLTADGTRIETVICHSTYEMYLCRLQALPESRSLPSV
jgi:hypothetical protein